MFVQSISRSGITGDALVSVKDHSHTKTYTAQLKRDRSVECKKHCFPEMIYGIIFVRICKRATQFSPWVVAGVTVSEEQASFVLLADIVLLLSVADYERRSVR